LARPDAAAGPSVLLVDPSLFTGPYDAGLTQGLEAAGVRCAWAVRPLRRGERGDLPERVARPIFYRHVDRADWLPPRLRPAAKALAHLVGLVRLAALLRRERATLIHLQWAVIPIVDALFIRLIRRRAAIVVTVHDTLPYNGSPISWLQKAGFFLPARLASEVIVHTQIAAERVAAQGVDPARINIVPHGPLSLAVDDRPPNRTVDKAAGVKTFVLFGQLKPYKGVDILVEAVGLMPKALRQTSRFIVAGAIMMDMAPIERRIAELSLGATFELRYGRMSEHALADLFDEADVFLFPYRDIDASGAYYLVRPYGKWIIASRVGVFAEDFVEGEDGATVIPADPQDLARGLCAAWTEKRASGPRRGGADWVQIGARTQLVYSRAQAS
jgi:glycosyltransferase involved in cell wall biosynthesis